MTTYLLDATSVNSEGRTFGVSRYAYYLALGFSRIAYELAADERLLLAVRLSGDTAITDDLRIDRHTERVPMRYRAYNRGRRLYFGRTVQRAAADIVHFVEGPQVVSVPEQPWVVTCHDLIPILDPAHYVGGWYGRLKRRYRDYLRYTRARRVIAISNATADALVEHLELARERITVIPQGVDHDRFRPDAPPGERDDIRRACGLPARYAVYVGATDWRKRVDLLIACYQRVFRATGVPLAVVGPEFAPVKHAHIRRALRIASPGSIVIVGGVPADRLPALYRHADLHVLPSVYEGFGLTVLEAMACGCPVVATTGGAIPEAAGEAARLVEPDNAAQLESALVDLLQDAGARERLRVHGLERARRFSWERTARETLAVYRRATGRVIARAADGVGENRAREHRQQP
jgi:glycosyltransferase involved in cell wall biosynthesis